MIIIQNQPKRGLIRNMLWSLKRKDIWIIVDQNFVNIYKIRHFTHSPSNKIFLWDEAFRYSPTSLMGYIQYKFRKPWYRKLMDWIYSKLNL